jgi:hypothetical protein
VIVLVVMCGAEVKMWRVCVHFGRIQQGFGDVVEADMPSRYR